MLSSLPNSLNLLLQSINTSQQQHGQTPAGGAHSHLGPHPLGLQRNGGTFQIGGAASQSSAGQSSQQSQAMQTVFIGDLPKDISMVELYEYIKSVAGECDLVLKR